MSHSYIALGSNLGQPLAQLRAAVQAIASLPQTTIAAISPVYRSAAVGPGDQPDYLNAVLRLETTLAPLALLEQLQAIETEQGRERDIRWGARTLDLDILLYDTITSENPRLTLPHPRMAERNFVLYPLRDVAQVNLMLPDGRDLVTLLAACPAGDLARVPESLAPGEDKRAQ